MPFPESSERTSMQQPHSGSITPTRTVRTTFGGRGNPQPASVADTVSSWRQPHDTLSRPASRRDSVQILFNEPVEVNVVEEILPLRPHSNYSSPPNIYMPTNMSPIHTPLSPSHSPVPTSPTRSIHGSRVNNEVVSEEVLEGIREDPISFMSTFQETVINDIRQVHSNIVNSFSSIEQKYTRYFNTVNNVLLTRPEYDTVQRNLDQFNSSSTGITHRVMARSPSPLPTPNRSLHSPHAHSNASSIRLQNPVLPVDNRPPALPPRHTRPQYINSTPRYSELTTIPTAIQIPIAAEFHSKADQTQTTTATFNLQRNDNVSPILNTHDPKVKMEEMMSNLEDPHSTDTRMKVTDQLSSKAMDDENRKPIHSWTDRVAIQRQRNSDLRTKGSSQFPDQMVGFNDDGLPIDKSTTDRSTWEHRSAVNKPSDVGQTNLCGEAYDLKNEQTNSTTILSKGDDERTGNKTGTGGPSKDPGDDSSDNSSDDEKPEGDKPKRHRTPWEEDSADDIPESGSEDSSSDESWVDNLFVAQDNPADPKESKNKRKRAKKKLLTKMRNQSADDERRQLWAHAVHRVYKKQIKHYVGKPLPELDGTKNIRIPTPDTYNGSSDVEIFDAWLLAVLRWMVISRYCGPDFDKFRVQLVGIYLSVRWAARMTQPPNTYAFKKCFLDGLPFEIVKRLIDLGAVPEYAKINTIVKAVERIEDNHVLKDYYVSSNRKKGKESSYLEKRSKFERKLSNSGPDYKPKPVMVDGKPYKYVRFHKHDKPAGRIQNLPTNPNRHKKHEQDRGKSKGITEGDRHKTSGKPSQLCYACGKVGHYANDPSYERYGQSRMYSIQEEDQPSASTSVDIQKVADLPEDVPEAVPVSDSESESDGEWLLAPYEDDYVGHMYEDDDEDMNEFMATIDDNIKDHHECELGPVITIEENFDREQFHSVDTKTLGNSVVQYDLLAARDSKHPDNLNYSNGITMKQSSRPMSRPDRGPIKERRPLTASMDIGGIKAFVLLDSGCTIEALSPSFARVANIKTSGVQIENIIDEEYLRDELNRKKRSLHHNSPVILEEITDVDREGKVIPIEMEDVDNYTEIIQEFYHKLSDVMTRPLVTIIMLIAIATKSRQPITAKGYTVKESVQNLANLYRCTICPSRWKKYHWMKYMMKI
ncbi:hypothetical protein C8R42DRAFT_643332 [Lentinula raphanica]|nr:hypothetical protein C8R42DRAFT_643332 [Lentinula raphanica]